MVGSIGFYGNCKACGEFYAGPFTCPYCGHQYDPKTDVLGETLERSVSETDTPEPEAVASEVDKKNQG
jgi:hypothetical protein